MRGKKSDSFVKLQMKRVALVERIPVGECGRRYRDKAAAVVASIILVCKVPQLFLLRAIAERGHHGTPLRRCQTLLKETVDVSSKTGNPPTLEIVAKYAESVNAQLGDLVQRLTVVEETLNTELQPAYKVAQSHRHRLILLVVW